MNRPGQNADGEDTTHLHLGRFAHGAPGAGAGKTAESGEEAETELIRRAATETVADHDPAKRVVVPTTAGPMCADELLGAVAYCYVKGVFSSTDIERLMLRDPEFRDALKGVVPDPDTLRRFRRLNRDAIQTVLEKFYAHLRRQQKCVREVSTALGTAASPATSGRNHEPAVGENTAIFVKREATECLDKAIFIDGMSDF